MTHRVIVIGAGGVGCAIARELSRYKELSITVLEKDSDVASGTSGRNSAVVHAGFNNKPRSLMARLCVKGNESFKKICSDLNVPFKNTGKVLVAFDEDDIHILEKLLKQGEQNGCADLKLINEAELKKLAPSINGIGGMYSPHTSIFDPFTYCIALAENAASNGAVFYFNSKVTEISHLKEEFFIKTADGKTYKADVVINCAGLYSDKISDMAGVSGYHIYPCRGEYFILDKVASLLPIPVYPAPKAGIGGLGVHITPTIDGNLILGPSAEYIDECDDYSCTAEIMEKLFKEAKTLLPSLERKHIIGNYAGIRAKQAPASEGGFRDFTIKEEYPGFINLIGIESPGLTASIPIAHMVRDIIAQRIDLSEKTDFINTRKGSVRFRDLPEEEQAALIASDSEYGEIICRCQKVTKREIRNAIENPLGVKPSISAIKYRAWPTTGRCNGGYCLTRIVDMLINEYGMKPEEIMYRNSGSEMFSGSVK